MVWTKSFYKPLYDNFDLLSNVSKWWKQNGSICYYIKKQIKHFHIHPSKVTIVTVQTSRDTLSVSSMGPQVLGWKLLIVFVTHNNRSMM